MQVNFTTVQVAANRKGTNENASSYSPLSIAACIAAALKSGFPTRFTTSQEVDEMFLAYYSDLEILVSEVVRVNAGSKASGCHDKLNQVVVMFSEYPVFVYQTEDDFYNTLESILIYFRFDRIESGFVLTKLW
jgi:hypothetical protein